MSNKRTKTKNKTWDNEEKWIHYFIGENTHWSLSNCGLFKFDNVAFQPCRYIDDLLKVFIGIMVLRGYTDSEITRHLLDKVSVDTWGKGCESLKRALLPYKPNLWIMTTCITPSTSLIVRCDTCEENLFSAEVVLLHKFDCIT